MTHVLRPALPADLPAIYGMAKSTGGGFTSLPPDRGVLEGRLHRAAAALAGDGDRADALFFFVLEGADGRIAGTCQIVPSIGGPAAPFRSYRLGSEGGWSEALGRRVSAETLTLCTDLDGSTEVGGLYLLAHERSAGLGALLARARYLFIAAHRHRFNDQVVAELRGVHDEAGGSPFWDGVARRFFNMSFQEADAFNASRGTHHVAALMPRHPLYLALLPEGALASVGVPHQSGRAAMRMLEWEGFQGGRYLDVLDGGPTMVAATDQVRTVREAREAPVAALVPVGEDGRAAIVAHGRLATFRAALGRVADMGDGLALDPSCARRIGAGVGDRVLWVAR